METALIITVCILYFLFAVSIKRSIFEDAYFRDKFFNSRAARIIALLGSLIWPISIPLVMIIGGIFVLFEDV